ncbi:hypothetical protein G5B40_07255 [Pikeienuella piscinae]|uniref:General secretion pathway protein L n=1 Tax=Pikeienuella piscinae TaxID=2748098 RepID=A0A7L5BTE9_9RHOB|nr:hypothetical protein [Pikeienuella piscinae]QIE55270.1 hypothetical protein G5B40_07255 [Pikeienuella piscinae]
MSGLERIGDFFIWLGETAAALFPTRPPARALGVEAGGAALYRHAASGYVVERPAQSGDSAPLLLSSEQAFTARITVAPEAAPHGSGPARLEAARRSPVPLEEAEWALTRAPDAWDNGAPWRFAASPRRRVAALRETLRAAGARPGPAFTMVEGAPLHLTANGPRAPRLVLAAAALAVFAILGAALSAPLGAARIEAAAEARLADARAALDAAESEAAEATGRRDAATAPIRAARAGRALLASNPPAAAALARLAAATPDDAYATRLTIRPNRVEGEFSAPDAAKLAATLAATPGFAAARLRGAARAAPGGLQRAAIELTPARGSE